MIGFKLATFKHSGLLRNLLLDRVRDLIINLARVPHVALHLLSVGLLLLLLRLGLFSSLIAERVNLVHIVLIALNLKCLSIFTFTELNLALINTLLSNFSFLG